MMRSAPLAPSGPCVGLVLLLLIGLAVHDARADSLMRFHCRGMMGGRQHGAMFDALLDAEFAYDPVGQVISQWRNGNPIGNWRVTLDGHVLRWTSDERQEFLDLDRPAYGFDWHAANGDASYGRANCTLEGS